MELDAQKLLQIIEKYRSITTMSSFPYLVDQGKTILWFNYALLSEPCLTGKPYQLYAIMQDNETKSYKFDLQVPLEIKECVQPPMDEETYTEKLVEMWKSQTEDQDKELLKQVEVDPFWPMYEAVENLWEHRNDETEAAPEEKTESEAEETVIEETETVIEETETEEAETEETVIEENVTEETEAEEAITEEPESTSTEEVTEVVEEEAVTEEIEIEPNPVMAGLFGAAVADALGVPVEFKDREELDADPVKDMRGFGSHRQPAGTWSDDTSLMIALMDGLVKDDSSLKEVGRNFVAWSYDSAFTAGGLVFDCGYTTNRAISRMERGFEPELCGDAEEQNNGNGSLMRILPMAYVLQNEPSMKVRQMEVFKVSAMTHAHIVSKMACHIYVELAIQALQGKNIDDAYDYIMTEVYDFYKESDIEETEIAKFDRVFSGKLYSAKRDDIRSGGYVLDTLEAALWSLTHWISYEQAVLHAVNLGKDTDTTAIVTGGLAGILYGFDAIPKAWVDVLQNKALLVDIGKRFSEKYLCK